MTNLSQGLRTLALASESRRAFEAAEKRKKAVKEAAEKQRQGRNRGLTAEQGTRLRLAEAAQRAYARNRGGLELQRSSGAQNVQRMAALLQAIDRNRAAGGTLKEIFAKRRS